MAENAGIVQVKTGFVFKNRVVRRGETFAADHPLVKGHERHFRPLRGEGIESASAAPGEVRPIAPLRSEQTRPPRRRRAG